jgi:hypothetical protein
MTNDWANVFRTNLRIDDDNLADRYAGARDERHIRVAIHRVEASHPAIR